MEKQNQSKQKIFWHKWFGTFLRLLLEPLGLQVETEHAVMKELPEADVVIIRNKTDTWTREQLKWLPDGIRQSKARYILIEFKYSESLNDDTFCQIGGYHYFFRVSHKKLKKKDFEAFIVSSKKPQQKFMKQFGYDQTRLAGVLKSKTPVMRIFPIISLNELEDKPYNKLFKAFSSKKKVILNSIKNVTEMSQNDNMSNDIVNFFISFFRIILGKGGKEMHNFEFTKKELDQMYKSVQDMVMMRMKPENLSKYFKSEDVMKSYKPEDVMKSFKPKDRIKGLKPEDIMNNLSPNELDLFEAYFRANKRKKA